MSDGREVLRTEDLWKQYGRITAVAGMDLEVFDGEVFSFLGPNGSGKSTTIGMILGLVRPTRGRALVFGNDVAVAPWPALRRVGAIVEAPAFYPYLSGYDNLKYIALALGDVPHSRIDAVLELVGLRDRGRDPFKTYSLGMKQRLGIGSTLLRDPELIILDEPTNGLDPAGTREVRELIPCLSRDGHSVFLCSHMLNEVQAVSDRVAIVNKGRMVVQGTVAELLSKGQYLRLQADDNESLLRALGTFPFVTSAERIDGFVRARMPVARAGELNKALGSQGLWLTDMTRWEVELESVFLELTGEELKA